MKHDNRKDAGIAKAIKEMHAAAGDYGYLLQSITDIVIEGNGYLTSIPKFNDEQAAEMASALIAAAVVNYNGFYEAGEDFYPEERAGMI